MTDKERNAMRFESYEEYFKDSFKDSKGDTTILSEAYWLKLKNSFRERPSSYAAKFRTYDEYCDSFFGTKPTLNKEEWTQEVYISTGGSNMEPRDKGVTEIMDEAEERFAVQFPSYEAYKEANHRERRVIVFSEKSWTRLKFKKASEMDRQHPLAGINSRLDEMIKKEPTHFSAASEAAGQFNTGMKHDDGKKKWHALPLEILEPLADVMEAGVKKYAKFNCLEKFDNPDERFYNGMMRHIKACQVDPLAIDKETGCYHAAQVAFNTLMRLYHCKKDAEESDLEDF